VVVLFGCSFVFSFFVVVVWFWLEFLGLVVVLFILGGYRFGLMCCFFFVLFFFWVGCFRVWLFCCLAWVLGVVFLFCFCGFCFCGCVGCFGVLVCVVFFVCVLLYFFVGWFCAGFL